MGFLVPKVEIFDDNIFAKIKELILQPSRDGEKLFFVTPYVKLEPKIREEIEHAVKRRADITFLVRKDAERNSDDSEFLANSHVKVYEHEFLHAKIYLSDTLAIVTSMNLYDFSDRRSREIALLLNDAKEINTIRGMIEKWIEKSRLIPPTELGGNHSHAKKRDVAAVSDSSSHKQSGFCIVGDEPIPLNGERPLCDTHFNKLRNGLYDYQGHFCHRCGRKEDTKHLQPFCHDCWEKMGKPKFAKIPF